MNPENSPKTAQTVSDSSSLTRTASRTSIGTHESTDVFETRKSDHIRASMDPKVQAGGAGFDKFEFLHEALPDLNFDEVSISATLFRGSSFEQQVRSPFFISSMTAGHKGSQKLNEIFAEAAAAKGWAMGVGSQRRELGDASARDEWRRVRKSAPGAMLFGNIGISQLIQVGPEPVLNLIEALEAKAMFIHLNPLQEVLQPEGTPQFKGGLAAIEKLAKLSEERLSVPIVVKETGCGISALTATKLFDVGVRAVDVAGRGGTHWGRIEGIRAKEAKADVLSGTAESFKNWGLSTVDSLLQVSKACELRAPGREVWASGGVRSGIDGAKALHFGAKAVGLAQPILAAALESEEALHLAMDRFDYELKTVLFCCGVRDLALFQKASVLYRVDDVTLNHFDRDANRFGTNRDERK